MMYLVKKSRTLLTGVEGATTAVKFEEASARLTDDGREVEGTRELRALRGSFLGEMGDL